MRILIDILHPAHVHFFRHFHDEMADRGHELCITARAKDGSLELLDRFGLPYHHLSDQRSGKAGLAIELVQRTRRLLEVMREFRPDVLTGIMGPTIALAGAVRRTPAIVFYDTEFAVAAGTPDQLKARVGGDRLEFSAASDTDPRQLAAVMTGLGNGPPTIDADTGRVVIPVADGPSVLPDVAARIASHGLRVSTLAIRRPTLDDVFLSLTGQAAPARSTADIPRSRGL